MPLNIPKPTKFVQAGYKPVEGGFEKKQKKYKRQQESEQLATVKSVELN
ncbi:hypothetical protein [Aliivibrio fischeri]